MFPFAFFKTSYKTGLPLEESTSFTSLSAHLRGWDLMEDFNLASAEDGRRG